MACWATPASRPRARTSTAAGEAAARRGSARRHQTVVAVCHGTDTPTESPRQAVPTHRRRHLPVRPRRIPGDTESDLPRAASDVKAHLGVDVHDPGGQDAAVHEEPGPECAGQTGVRTARARWPIAARLRPDAVNGHVDRDHLRDTVGNNPVQQNLAWLAALLPQADEARAAIALRNRRSTS